MLNGKTGPLVLSTKADYEFLLEKLLKPFISLYSGHKSTIELPMEVATSYNCETMHIEAFSRSLLGWSMLDGHEDIKKVIFSMIINGIKKGSALYWGNLKDNDQKIVEMFPILMFCIEEKELFMQCFTEENKRDLHDWFIQINQVQVPTNNWQFFIVIINRFLQLLGLDYSQSAIEEAFARIDKMYLRDGWYSDGISFQRDYYIAFAFHYYSLLYLKYTPQDSRRNVILKRADNFCDSFLQLFAGSGCGIAFGRSLTYKFAQIAFFSIYTYFITDAERMSLIKGYINRNFSWWFNQDIIADDGFLNLGYSYGNQFMTEFYNARGSSYWCLKSFIHLKNKSDLFFSVKPAEFTCTESKEYNPALLSTIIRHKGHSLMFMNGQHSNNEFGNTEAKYGKFLYSTYCAPCVSRSPLSIENLAADNDLVVGIGENLILRNHAVVVNNSSEAMVSLWSISPEISITTYIFPSSPYHYRLHVVKTNTALTLYDFGTALPNDENIKTSVNGNKAIANRQNIISAIYSVKDQGIAGICKCTPNVNLQYTKVLIPYVSSLFDKGEHYVIDCCFIGEDTEFSKIKRESISVKSDVINYNNVQIKIKAKTNKNFYSNAIRVLKALKKINHNLK